MEDGPWRPSSIAFSGRFRLMSYELGIIGAGQMAEAIVRGLLRAGLYQADQLIAADVAEARRRLFSQELKINAVEGNAEVARQSKALLLSVKPYQTKDVLGEIGGVLSPEPLIVSIAA